MGTRPIDQKLKAAAGLNWHPHRQGRAHEADATRGEHAGKRMRAISDERISPPCRTHERPWSWRSHIVILDECLAQKRALDQPAHRLHASPVH
jgi:hypothetical protein